jgi:hypothetical protein
MTDIQRISLDEVVRLLADLHQERPENKPFWA